MQNLPMLLGGLGCLIVLGLVFWKPPSVQDEDHQAEENDEEDEAMPDDPPFID